MADPQTAVANPLRNIEVKTGKSFAELCLLIQTSGPSKVGEQRQMLMQQDVYKRQRRVTAKNGLGRCVTGGQQQAEQRERQPHGLSPDSAGPVAFCWCSTKAA